MIIAAVLIFVFIKPMFKQASQTASSNLGEAKTIATGFFFLAKKAIDN
jgi:fucose permease